MCTRDGSAFLNGKEQSLNVSTTREKRHKTVYRWVLPQFTVDISRGKKGDGVFYYRYPGFCQGDAVFCHGIPVSVKDIPFSVTLDRVLSRDTVL